MNTPDETVFKRVPPEINMRQPHDGQTRFIIMYHGTLVERNGVDLAVDALAKNSNVGSIGRAENLWAQDTIFGSCHARCA